MVSLEILDSVLRLSHLVSPSILSLIILRLYAGRCTDIFLQEISIWMFPITTSEKKLMFQCFSKVNWKEKSIHLGLWFLLVQTIFFFKKLEPPFPEVVSSLCCMGVDAILLYIHFPRPREWSYDPALFIQLILSLGPQLLRLSQWQYFAQCSDRSCRRWQVPLFHSEC